MKLKFRRLFYAFVGYPYIGIQERAANRNRFNRVEFLEVFQDIPDLRTIQPKFIVNTLNRNFFIGIAFGKANSFFKRCRYFLLNSLPMSIW